MPARRSLGGDQVLPRLRIGALRHQGERFGQSAEMSERELHHQEQQQLGNQQCGRGEKDAIAGSVMDLIDLVSDFRDDQGHGLGMHDRL